MIIFNNALLNIWNQRIYYILIAEGQCILTGTDTNTSVYV